MAKRPTVEVDEEYLKEVMAGNIARPKKEQPQLPTTQPEVEEKDIPETPEAKELVKPTRKKREAQDYESLFLERKVSEDKRQVYISRQLSDKINSFLSVIAGHQLGITNYINNILTHHLERYKEDINELYERKSQKPF